MKISINQLVLLSILFFFSCSGSTKKNNNNIINNINPPPAVCEEGIQPLDTTNPDHIIGDGTPNSCTEDALVEAAESGGIIKFNCGADPVEISLSNTIVFDSETVIDGGGLVTLNGHHNTRIFYLDSDYNTTTPTLTVQGITFVNGSSGSDGDDTAQGGGAIYRDGGSLQVINCNFINNTAPSPGQDIAGGAIYAFGGGFTTIAGSTFTENTASNGGAIGSLNGDLTVINSVFSENAATGRDGNPGNGGCGGAIYQDGRDEITTFCGVLISNNSAGAIGGGVFRVSNDNSGTFIMDKTTVDSNVVTASGEGNAGGLYLQGLDMSITASTISRNSAHYNGGIWIHTSVVHWINVTVAENLATGSNGGGLWLSGDPTGVLLNCTIANNHADADGQGAGAVFGGNTNLILKNTIISGNTGWWGSGCQNKLGGAGGNFQWIDAALCTDDVTVADVHLGPLTDNGGSTETMLPAVDSPAAVSVTDCPTTDQRGEARPEICTAGATEVSSN
ncbi:right-handed parallel beta-helix repeat-containing protein [Myxococcota bacterium]|nr:right-handed parallel beta-helix repeat-containing protein [Myxococcota bacterium]MBU1380323.1 right-handed parallel beta-helix repeat-containing protein [Myxococcota bacterium]MBU1495311.1 right-handed parallel beta-helix repeat-containing protein [Myxococcota bacterium]